MDQKSVAQLDNAFKVLEKEGNKVARDGKLPPGKNAEAGHDVASFNAGMRYAMARMKTSIKQIQDGKYVVVEFPKQGQHAVPAAGAAASKPAAAKKGTTAKKAAAPAKKTAPAKAEAPAKKSVAKKAAPAKKAPAAKKSAPVKDEAPQATVTDISSAKAKRVRKTASKTAADA